MELWLFALKAAERVHNNFYLDSSGHSPLEKFTRITTLQDTKHEHPLFCAIYALDSRLQGSLGGLPKWEPRSRLGVSLGHSPDHASNVALVLDPRTRLVSPQYHVVFDDSFSTVDHLKNNTTPPNWEDLCHNHTEFFVDNFNEATLLGEINSALGDPSGVTPSSSNSDNMLSAPSTSLDNVSSDSASNNNLSEGDIMQADQLQSASSEGDFILEPENYNINPINPEGDSPHNINVPEEDSSCNMHICSLSCTSMHTCAQRYYWI